MTKLIVKIRWIFWEIWHQIQRHIHILSPKHFYVIWHKNLESNSPKNHVNMTWGLMGVWFVGIREKKNVLTACQLNKVYCMHHLSKQKCHQEIFLLWSEVWFLQLLHLHPPQEATNIISTLKFCEFWWMSVSHRIHVNYTWKWWS